jgi:SHS2 domain-containing protein
MPYRFIEEEATADIAFEAWGKDLNEVFRDAGNALTNVMIENPETIKAQEELIIKLDNEKLDLLLFNFLEQIIFHKDAEQLLLTVAEAVVTQVDDSWKVDGLFRGETLDPSRHHQMVDVKAVTLHDFSLKQKEKEWRAHLVLDI